MGCIQRWLVAKMIGAAAPCTTRRNAIDYAVVQFQMTGESSENANDPCGAGMTCLSLTDSQNEHGT